MTAARKFATVIGIVAGLIALCLDYPERRDEDLPLPPHHAESLPSPKPPQPETVAATPAPELPRTTRTSAPMAPLENRVVAPRAAVPVGAAALPPDKSLSVLRVSVRNYGERFRGNPVGNNAEITAALNGKNPQQVRFLDPNVAHINDKGELVDDWGTPYFFHQISGNDMEIRSAGADRKMWTADDLVTR